MLLLFLTGVGALLAWRKTSTESLKRNFGWPLGIGVAAGAIAFAFGFRQLYSWVCLILCVFVASTVLLEFYRGAKVIRARSGAWFVASALELTMRNTRRYGGYVVHMGIGFALISLAGPAFRPPFPKNTPPAYHLENWPSLFFLHVLYTQP